MPFISSLHVYPVKSCRGFAPAAARLTMRGLLHDREWLIVDPTVTPHRFVTQREFPRLALIGTAVTDRELRLLAPGQTALAVGLDADGPRCNVVVWRDTVPATDQGQDAADWLSTFVGTNLKLVRFAPEFERRCNRQYAGDSGAHTGFADGYPLLLIGTSSLADLNARLAARGQPALPMNRFRPNIVVDGWEPYDEDHFAEVATGEARMRMVKPCVRCQITTTDQDSAAVGVEPLLTLAGYREHSTLGGVTFGMNAIVTAGAGQLLAVGQPVETGWNFDVSDDGPATASRT